jgi:hypothetical protein
MPTTRTCEHCGDSLRDDEECPCQAQERLLDECRRMDEGKTMLLPTLDHVRALLGLVDDLKAERFRLKERIRMGQPIAEA